MSDRNLAKIIQRAINSDSTIRVTNLDLEEFDPVSEMIIDDVPFEFVRMRHSAVWYDYLDIMADTEYKSMQAFEGLASHYRHFRHYLKFVIPKRISMEYYIEASKWAEENNHKYYFLHCYGVEFIDIHFTDRDVANQTFFMFG